MGVDFGDYDGDGDQDFYVTNFSADVNTLYRNDGKGMFADATAAAGLDGPVRPFVGWSTAFLDADNDGWQDLFVATATSTRSWRSSRPRCATGSATSFTGITGAGSRRRLTPAAAWTWKRSAAAPPSATTTTTATGTSPW